MAGQLANADRLAVGMKEIEQNEQPVDAALTLRKI